MPGLELVKDLRDVWVKDSSGKKFGLGVICFDTSVKEMVKISTGICILNHSTPAAYEEAHKDGGCVLTPQNVLAIRPNVNGRMDRVTFSVIHRVADASTLRVAEEADQRYFDEMSLKPFVAYKSRARAKSGVQRFR
jgi:hypothetical protein